MDPPTQNETETSIDTPAFHDTEINVNTNVTTFTDIEPEPEHEISTAPNTVTDTGTEMRVNTSELQNVDLNNTNALTAETDIDNDPEHEVSPLTDGEVFLFRSFLRHAHALENSKEPLNLEEISLIRLSIGGENVSPQSIPTIKPGKGSKGNRALNQDAFSFLLFDTSLRSTCMTYAVFLVQLSIFVFIWVDVARTRALLNLPATVSGATKATGFFALIIAVLTQDDLRTSIQLWKDGFTEHVFSRKLGGASRPKWIVSTACRAVGGILSLAVSLLLIVQAEDAVDLLLNFTAIEVVSQLDDAAFVLARLGYLGSKVEEDAAKVINLTYTIEGKDNKWFRKGILFGIFSILLILWSIAVQRQLPPEPTPAPTPAPTTFASTCQPNQSVLRVEVKTGNFLEPTKWSVTNNDNKDQTLLVGGPYSRISSLFADEVCVDDTDCYAFEVTNDAGNRGNGTYALFLDGEDVGQGAFRNNTELAGGSCPCQSCPFSSRSRCLELGETAASLNRTDPQCHAIQAANVYCGCPEDESDATVEYCRLCESGPLDGETCISEFLEEEVKANTQGPGSPCPTPTETVAQRLSSFGCCQ